MPCAFGGAQVVVAEGKLSSGLHFIEQGTIDVIQGGAKVSQLSDADFFGESSLLSMISSDDGVAGNSILCTHHPTTPRTNGVDPGHRRRARTPPTWRTY